MNKSLKNYLNFKKIYLWKPSKTYWTFIIFAFLVWIFLGPIWWRHIDDFGTIDSYLIGEEPLWSKYRLLKGWGTYPPIWTFWSFPTLNFKFIGMTQIRYLILIQGFISTAISSYLTICVLLNLTMNLNKRHYLDFKKIIEILSITFNCLNPQIMMHASTYMPYNLSTITSLTLLILLIPAEINKSDLLAKNDYFVIKKPIKYFLPFVIFSILLSFQSFILLSAFLLTIFSSINIFKFDFANLNEKLVEYRKKSLSIDKNSFIKSNFLSILFYLITFLFTGLYILKMFSLVKNITKPGLWANGQDNIYDISIFKNEIYQIFIKIFNSTVSIIGQSTYNFRFFQEEMSLFIFFILFFSLFLKRNKKDINKIFYLNTLIVFSISIGLSIFGNFVYSPTRHTIFLYPFIWIFIILQILYLYEYVKINLNYLVRKYLITLSLSIFIFQSIGLVNSHSLIQYNPNEREELLKMANESDYHIPIFNNSFFGSHGNEENQLLTKYKCPDIEKSNFRLFIYNHRKPLKLNEKNIINIARKSKGCINSKDKFTLLRKIEKENKLDIEQNNKIFNGGSGLYGYLLEIKRNN